ncbi:enoyl-CoA hydratase/isomerase family protein [Nocardia alba]|uniref:Enoyl-CoA hydratase/carnithine racemase n=1 Tax=Nocardia alba TaxID=225051 RepID=A0A4R1FYS7_9NOCA|nr:enoyl-CoA hydratase/isomerase family protein [Nocardia alba]TCJ96421.1 enoyl-CoA hydratase/carnithine racemase [Nocardia alba]
MNAVRTDDPGVPTTGRRLIAHRSGRVLTVRFDNPPRHFFDEQMSIELDALTKALRRDSTVRAVIFTGSADTYLTHFHVPALRRGAEAAPVSIGYRPARLIAAAARLTVACRQADAALRHTVARDALFVARTYAALDRLSRLDQVVITEINGLALGMGFIFALACDIRIMADDTEIGLVESGLAVLAGATGTQRLTHAVGAATAVELLLEGRVLTAEEAARSRLVHHVYPRAELPARTRAIAERLAGRSPAVTREIKRSVYDSATRPARAALRAETASLIRTLTTDDAARALAIYDDYLATHEPLTDEVILRGWTPLLGNADTGQHI